MAGGLELFGLYGPFQHNPFYDSCVLTFNLSKLFAFAHFSSQKDVVAASKALFSGHQSETKH